MEKTTRSGRRAGEELLVITKAYDLVREMTARVGGFPRDRKFVLGDRILGNVYDVMDLLIEAKYTREKGRLLDRAYMKLEQVRFQIRLAHDEKLISNQQYGAASSLVDELGRQVGGWRKSMAGVVRATEGE